MMTELPSRSDRHRSKRRKTGLEEAADGADTHALEEASPLPAKPVPRPFEKLPSELRVDIAEYAIQQHYDSIIVASETGEKLEDIWNRVHHATPSNDWSAIESDTWSCTVTMVAYGSLDVRYDYNPQVPSLLQLNHALREEGCEAFGKLAMEKMALAEDQHSHDMALYINRYYNYLGTGALRRLQKMQGGPFTVSRGDMAKAKERMDRYGVRMVRHTLRWHALRHICKLLELQS